jgi:hypothetical protein
MADWVRRSTALLEPLADEIGRIVRRGDALFADDTPVKMQTPGQKKTKRAGSGPMRATGGHARAKHRPVPGISLPLIARLSIPSATLQATSDGSTRMTTPGSTAC